MPDDDGTTLEALFAKGQRVTDLDADDFGELVSVVIEEAQRRGYRGTEAVRAATSDEWEAFHQSGGPSPLDRGVAKLTVEFSIVAETMRDAEKVLDAIVRPGEDDERLIEYRVDWPKSDRAASPLDRERDWRDDAAVDLLDQRASLARTALDDPGGLPSGEPFSTVGPQASEADALRLYAIDQLDQLIGAINPAELTRENAAQALGILARHVADIGKRLDSEGITEAGRSMVGDTITAGLDRIREAVSLLTGDDD